MTAAQREPLCASTGSSPDPLDAFELRCWARARLYRDGELDLHDAVDELQRAAVAGGLVEQHGQDHVQEIMALAFRAVRDDLRCSEPEPERAPEAKRAPAATVEALMFVLRERGEAALAERDTLRRLGDLSTQQVRDVIGRLIGLRAQYPAITDDLLFKLGGVLK
jgi:hypothetical protein